MMEIGVLKNFDSGTYKAGVQLAGSLTTYFDDISVARNIPSSALVIGNYVILAIPGANPKDACVIATWPQGTTPQPHDSMHESGGSGEINLTDLKGLPRDCFPFPDTGYHEPWKNLDGWTQSTSGSGSISVYLLDLRLLSGTTVSSLASIYLTTTPLAHPYLAGFRIFTTIQSLSNLTASEIRLYDIHTGVSLPPSDTSKHAGFKIIDGEIYATNGDGANETSTDTGESIAAIYKAKTLELRGTGSGIEFYVDGALKAIHTTHLPADLWNYRLWLGITNTDAVAQSLRMRTLNIIGF